MPSQRVRRPLRTLVASALALSLTAGAGLAFAGGDSADTHQRRHEQRAQKRLDRALDRIDAQGEQRASLEALAREGMELSIASRKASRADALALRAQFLAPKPDRDAVHGLVDSLSTAKTKNGHALVDLALSAHAILTPEQRDRIASRLDTPLPAFRGSWFVDAGVASVLEEIEADDAQRELVAKHKASLEREVDGLISWRNTIAPELAALIRADDADADAAHALLDKASLRVTAVAHDAADAAVDLTLALDDAQRARLLEMARERHDRRR